MSESVTPGISPLATYKVTSSDSQEGVAIVSVFGEISDLTRPEDGPLVRMHSACVYGEVLDSTDCECGPQWETAQERIAHEGAGVLFYLRQEGRGAGLVAKAKGYILNEQEGLGTDAAYERMGLPFDQRRYGHCARFLLTKGIDRVRLMSNNPRKISALEEAGISVTRVPLIVGVTDQNRSYLRIKRDMGHMLPDNI